MAPVNLDASATLKFDEKGNKISGVAACNSFRAGYEMSGRNEKTHTV